MKLHDYIAPGGTVGGERHQMSMLDALLRAVEIAPERPAVVEPDGSWRTWSNVLDRVKRLATGFAGAGAHPGDRVAVALPNSKEYLECFFACAWAGLVIAPLNTRLSESELSSYLDLVDPALVVTDPAFSLPETRAGVVQVGDAAPRGGHCYERLASSLPMEEPVLRNDHAPAALFSTGGTTGTPKAVILTHRNVVAGSHHIQMSLAYRQTDVYLHAAPMFHIADFASLLAVTMVGGAHAFIAPFRPLEFARQVQQASVTATLLVPTMVRMLLDDEAALAHDLSSWRLLFYGGAPMPQPTVRRAMERLPCRLAQGYGMTEISLGAVLSEEDHALAHRGGTGPAGLRLHGIGRAAYGVRIEVDSPDENGVGELLVAGPNVCAGYWRNEEATRQTFTEEGWCRTGDLGRMDGEGYLELVDRLKDVVITGGENVYCLEVERLLAQHAGVAQVAVVGLPDPLWGERVHAVVVPTEEWCSPSRAADLPDEVIALGRRFLAPYKVPRSISLAKALPVTGPGKIDKKALRRLLSISSTQGAGNE
ncbi:class I adenylate-forming enzyme family protein [Streptomyces sp. NPDC087908]|uniref:class I adenylate-forming enzyme family protein n=1 Tax=Streptomyces sp. NPDC087908 TaxID=3365820 RepID=UPI00380D9461